MAADIAAVWQFVTQACLQANNVARMLPRIGRKRMKRLLVVISTLVAFCLALPAQAALTIQITHANDQAIPIAITAFKGQDNLPQPISRIVADDLRNSGVLAPLGDLSLVATPGSAIEYDV